MRTAWDFPVWKRVEVKPMTVEVFHSEMSRIGIEEHEGSGCLIDQLKFESLESKEVDLALVTPSDLGFQESKGIFWVEYKAQSLGFQMYDPEIVPAIVLSNPEVANGDFLVFAHHSMARDSSKGAMILPLRLNFGLRCIGGRRELVAFTSMQGDTPGHDQVLIPPNDKLIFALPRK